MKRNHANITQYLYLVALIVFSGPLAIAADREVEHANAQSDSSNLLIDIEKCRLSGYSVLFDIMEGSKRVGKASRTLTTADKLTQLSSHVEASIAFLSFTQSEQSTLDDYPSAGFASNQYLKSRKKPLSKTKTTKFSIAQNSLPNGKAKHAIFDPLSVYDHLRELVCSGLKQDLALEVQEETEIQRYYFEYRGLQQLQQGNITKDAILMVRTRPASSRETFVWFDTNNRFLPIKIEQEKNGKTQATLVAHTATATQ
ncbi:MAG: DUF3108 domain-containing protein [Glaciecola sp.]|jgi:hypothetical protein